VKRGRPKNIQTVVYDRNSPESYPSLIKYLEATGKVKHNSYAVMLKARNMYLRCVNTEKIALELHVEPSVIDRWILCFSWDEDRDKRQFEQFRKIAGASQMMKADVGQRHDRIAGSIEQVAERLLQQHQDGKLILTTRDLSTLASMLKSTQEVRRVVRGQNVDKKEQNLTVNINHHSVLDKLAAALVDVDDRPRLKQIPSRTIAVGAEESIGRDAEYEVIDRNATQSSEADRED